MAHKLLGAAPSGATDAVTKGYADALGVSTSTVSTIMRRDSAGRAQVVDPSVAADIATKNYVDTRPYAFVPFIGRNTSTVTAATTTTIEVKDTNVGDFTFTAVAGATYRVRYQCRALSDATATTVDFRIRDGVASSPTNTSTLLAGGSIYLAVAAGTGSSQIIVENEVTGLSAGTHIIAAFYLRTAGTGNVSPSQATGQTRVLSVDRIA